MVPRPGGDAVMTRASVRAAADVLREKHNALDARVLDFIRAGIGRDFTDVCREIGTPTLADERAVDRSLQRLRRAGKIRFFRDAGWLAVSP